MSEKKCVIIQFPRCRHGLPGACNHDAVGTSAAPPPKEEILSIGELTPAVSGIRMAELLVRFAVAMLVGGAGFTLAAAAFQMMAR